MSHPHPYPVGTWVRGFVHGHPYQGHVTAHPTPDSIMVGGANYANITVLESEDLDALPAFAFEPSPDRAASAGSSARRRRGE